MLAVRLGSFLAGQRDQHYVRQLLRTGLPKHVDDLSGRVLGVCADMQQYVATASSESLPQTGTRAYLEDKFSEGVGLERCQITDPALFQG